MVLSGPSIELLVGLRESYCPKVSSSPKAWKNTFLSFWNDCLFLSVKDKVRDWTRMHREDSTIGPFEPDISF